MAPTTFVIVWQQFHDREYRVLKNNFKLSKKKKKKLVGQILLFIHSLVNETNPQKPQVLEVEVFHSRSLIASAVQLFAETASGRILVAMAHTVDGNTLPSPATLKCPNSKTMVRLKTQLMLRKL